jgi:hypothetical protein
LQAIIYCSRCKSRGAPAESNATTFFPTKRGATSGAAAWIVRSKKILSLPLFIHDPIHGPRREQGGWRFPISDSRYLMNPTNVRDGPLSALCCSSQCGNGGYHPRRARRTNRTRRQKVYQCSRARYHLSASKVGREAFLHFRTHCPQRNCRRKRKRTLFRIWCSRVIRLID